MVESTPSSDTLSKRSPWGIRHKVLGLVVVAAVLPTALVGTSSYWTARSTLMEKLSDQLNTRASLTAAKVSDWFQERQHDARVFAGSSIVASNLERGEKGVDPDASTKQIGAYLDEVNGRYGVYRTIAVLDRAGRPVAASGVLDDDDLERVRDRPFDSGPILEWSDEEAMLWLQSPVLGEDGRVTGRLVLGCDFETLRGEVTDADHLGRLRLTASPDRLLFEHPTHHAMEASFPQVVPGEGEIVELDDDQGVSVLAAARSIHGTNLDDSIVLTVTTDREVAFASVSDLRRRILLLSALAVLIVVGLAYGLVGGLIDPLERLTEGARSVARGDYDVGLPVRARDEIGYLTEVFNQMAATLKESHEHLEHLSTTDELTQLSNRRELQSALVDELAAATRTGRPLSILMIDIDRFKSFNDRFGHLRGDELLAELGGYLRASLPQDAHAARYGGEEFLVILPGAEPGAAVDTAEKLRKGFSEQAGAQGVTLSMGVATWRRDGGTAAELVEAADRALYEAKGRGRDRVVAASETSMDPSPVS